MHFSKSKRSHSDNADLASAYAELEEDEEVDEEEMEAINKTDSDREAGNSVDIKELTQEVDEEHNLSQAKINLGCFALTKVCCVSVDVSVSTNLLIQLTKLAKHIFHASILHEDLTESCLKAKIEPKNIVCSISTRWNTGAKILQHSLYLHLALEKLIAIEHHNTAKSAQLKCFKLKKDEWDLLTQLELILLVRSSVLIRSQILTLSHLAFSESN